jgi:hypothetical protein
VSSEDFLKKFQWKGNFSGIESLLEENFCQKRNFSEREAHTIPDN